MLNFEIFFNILVDNSKAGSKAKNFGEEKDQATEPNLFIRLVQIGNPYYASTGDFNIDSLAVTLSNYKIGCRKTKSSFFPIVDSSYKYGLKNQLDTKYQSAIEKMNKLVDIYWPDNYLDKRTYVAKLLQYCLSYIDENGRTKLFKYHKSQLMGKVTIPFEILLLECWYYVVWHSDNPEPYYGKDLQAAIEYAGSMEINLCPLAGYEIVEDKKKEDEIDDEFENDEFFNEKVKPNVNIEIGHVNIQGNNNNISAYTETQIINNYGEKKNE